MSDDDAGDGQGSAGWGELYHEAITELAGLNPIEYDRVRKERAKQLGCRVSTLDKLVEGARLKRHIEEMMAVAQATTENEVADEEVDGRALLDEIADIVNSHVVVGSGVADLCAAFVFHTYAVEAAGVSPILEITSPTLRCGKTTLARVLKRMCRGAIMASNISPAALFRVIDAYHPTLIIDEADSFLNLSEQLRGLLDAGHTRDDAFVIRCEGDSHEIVKFSTFGPKIIAMIGRPKPTIQDRSITVHMDRKQIIESVKRLPQSDGFQQLRKRCARWAKDHLYEIKSCEPAIPNHLNDREKDNFFPLFQIAEVVGGQWPKRLDEVATLMGGVDEEESARVMLLHDIGAIFINEDRNEITSQTMVERLNELEHRPWVEYSRGKPLTPPSLARLLKPFRIKPAQLWTGGGNARGYKKAWFEPLLLRYRPIQTARSLDTKETAVFGPNLTARNSPEPSTLKTAEPRTE